MIKHYCDVCAEEVSRNLVTDRIETTVILDNHPVKIEIILGVGTTWNVGDLCAKCLKRVFELL